jgi:hypothetical protein
MPTFLIVVGTLVLLIGTTILRGITLSVLWGWFIVPLGVVSIGIPAAMGIAMLVAMMTWQDVVTQKRELGGAFGVAIGQCLFALLAGYILTLFM